MGACWLNIAKILKSCCIWPERERGGEGVGGSNPLGRPHKLCSCPLANPHLYTEHDVISNIAFDWLVWDSPPGFL